MTILVVGGRDDDHALFMTNYLRQKNADVELVDSRWYPKDLQISFDPGRRTGSLRMPFGRILDFDQIKSVYLRGTYGFSEPTIPDDLQRSVALQESEAMFETFLRGLNVRWVNGLDASRLHTAKPIQLSLMGEAGALIPPSIIGNNPDEVREFIEINKNCIFKPVYSGSFCERIHLDQLTDENLNNLCISPVTIQKEIEGTNCRIFVIGEEVLACEVPSESVDYRESKPDSMPALKLDEATQNIARNVARKLDLLMTGIDTRMTPDGQHYFLEANPSPMWLYYEKPSGLPFTEKIASLLMNT